VSKRTDISKQIKKYLNGKLDARAMHKFERQAQADPFLRDALEGYGLKSIDHDKNLTDLASRLKHRTARRERRIIPLRLIAIAATILIFLFAGLVWFINRPTERQMRLTNVKLFAPPKKTPPDTLLITEKKTEVATLSKKAPARIVTPTNASVQRSNAAQNTVAQPNADINISTPVGNSDAKVTEADPIQVPQDSLYSRRTAKLYKDRNVAAPGIAINGNIIRGVVKDEINNPIPGASVTIKGTNNSTVTDVNGKFTLPDVNNPATLDVAFIGYNKKEIIVKKQDSLVIAMWPNSAELGEVVVTGYGTKKPLDDTQQDYESAHPVNGWSEYNKYLKERAISPDGKTGVVKVSFTVNSNGRLSDFKILKGLSDAANNEAIQIITNGPAWITNSDRKPEIVKVRVKFAKPE
jgi:hypothetical protein